MIPLKVTCYLRGAVRESTAAGTSPALLDSLVMAALALDLGIPAAHLQSPAEREANERRLTDAMPLAREGRIWLASDAQYAREQHEVRHVNRRFPVAEAVAMGDARLKRVQLSTGLSKSYHIPVRQSHVVGDAVTWFAVGDAPLVRGLLTRHIRHIGKKRAVGCGPVGRWEVVPCERWDGFPVLLEGHPLRPLPLDWPGLKEWREDLRVLTPPYWERHREEPCAVAI